VIFGIGVDLCDISRISDIYDKYGAKFVNKILTNQEAQKFETLSHKKATFLAKRFAAKEAFVKALGTGFRNNISLRDIGTHSDVNNKPVMHYSNHVSSILKEKSIKNIFVSVSDETIHAIAFVTMEL